MSKKNLEDIGLGVDTISLAYTYNGEGNIIEIDTYLPIIKLLRNYKLGDKINIFYNKNNMNIIKSDIHFNTSLKTLVLWGTCLIIMVMSLYVSFIIGKKKKIERVLMKVGMIFVTVIGMCIMIL